MKSYVRQPMNKAALAGGPSVEAESLEAKIRRMMSNKEPIKDSGSRNYTARKDGVSPDMDIRTDKWEHAVEATDKVSRLRIASRGIGETGQGEAQSDGAGEENDGGTGSIDATN